MMEGIVIKSTGSWYLVRDDHNQIFRCRIVGKLRLDDLKSTNPIAVGDRVVVHLENEEEGQIGEILPRTNYVVRQSPRKKHQVHLIAANVDQAVLVTTITQPDVKPGFIDRFLMMTEPYDIPVIIVFNKWDIYDDKHQQYFELLHDIYSDIGYTVEKVSAHTGYRMQHLSQLLKDKVSLVSGQSGVGKTSLLNHLQPDLELRTDEISDYSGKGQHTTTFAEMLPLDIGGYIIDTPGIKTLGFNNLDETDVVHNFKEIFIVSENCKFNNCTHRNEPKCAVKDAVESGFISSLRYNSYLNILDEIEDQNYWERNMDV